MVYHWADRSPKCEASTNKAVASEMEWYITGQIDPPNARKVKPKFHFPIPLRDLPGFSRKRDVEIARFMINLK